MSTPLLFPDVYEEYEFTFTELDREYFNLYPTSKGNITEYFLRKAMGKGANVIFKMNTGES